ncbi:MAG TPA: FlgD immunoglobulin-like domain containing protein [bacterium]|nr:FlgD immunoglobulin-like domain containing protein [bacterium]
MRFLVGFLIVATAVSTFAFGQVESLPPPVVHGSSFEIISNSRYSSHSGFTSSLSDTVLSNVLWAMSRVPSFGSSYREIYVATPSNVYLYDTVAHVLNVYLAGNHRYSSNSAFEVGIAVERNEEAGLAAQAGLLAGDAFWSRGSGIVASCPMAFAASYADTAWHPNHTINLVDVFGHVSVTGLTDSCVAVSSDSTLPKPATDGSDTFELLVGSLGQDSTFDPAALPLPAVSQLLWAGYGVTPHMPTGKRGLTVPSAVANYYLTRKVYLVRDVGVDRYNNRLPPGTDLTTSDHRLEQVTAGDRRDSLRLACPGIPKAAPVYIVVCVADTTNSWHLLEAGFAGLQYLMQAHALGLQGRLTAPIQPNERAAIISALGLQSTDLPVVVFAVGRPVSAVEESARPLNTRLEAIMLRGGLLLRVRLVQSEPVRLAIYDPTGRLVRNWWAARLSAGEHSFQWDGKSDGRRSLRSGTYFCCLTTGASVHLTARLGLLH